MLYRMTAARAAFRAASSANASSAIRSAIPGSVFKAQLTSSARNPARLTSTPTLALAVRKPVTTALVRHASTVPRKGDSAHGIEEEDIDMMASVRNDAKVIKETFSLNEVPREALYIGLAGVLPYLVTSANTCFLAWEINNNAVAGSGFLLSGETASFLLHLTEPLQIGYGAVILSFLGAIHWGLEFAGYGGKHGFRRYATGCIAPAVAWPTLLLPVEHALITQFLAFTFLYYNDARAASRGLAPHWYGMYRFVLTFIVGASIVATLVGRERVSQSESDEHTLTEKIQALLFLRKKEIEEAKQRAQEKEEALE